MRHTFHARKPLIPTRWLAVIAALEVALAFACVAWAADARYLWAVVPLDIEPDWLDHPSADTVSAQVLYYTSGPACETCVGSQPYAMPYSTSITAIPWQRMWTEYATDGAAHADYRAPVGGN